MLYTFKFFFLLTTINFLLVIFSPYVYKYIDLLFLSLCVCIIGLYISYFSPGYFILPINNYENVIVTGFSKFILDMLFHIIPLLYVYIVYNNYYSKHFNIASALILIIVYSIFFDIEEIYNTNVDVGALILIIITVFYLYWRKKI